MPAKILYIDDEPDFLNSIVAILTRKGLDVIPARSGEEGMSIFEKEDIQLVISDYKMPGMSGTDVLKKIKQLKPDTCVILASAYPSTKNTLEALKYGAHDFLIKPFKLDDLTESITRGLHARLTLLQNRKIIQRYKRNLPLQSAQTTDVKIKQSYLQALELVEGLSGRHSSADAILVSAASLLQGGPAGIGAYELAMQVVTNCKRKEGTDDGDLVTAAVLAASQPQAVELFPRYYEVIYTAKQKLGSPDGHGVAAAILAGAGQQALMAFSDQTFEQVPGFEGSYDGLAICAAILAVQGPEKAAHFADAKQHIHLIKQGVGTEDGNNITTAMLLLGAADAQSRFEQCYPKILELKARKGSFDATGLAGVILALGAPVSTDGFASIYQDLALGGRGTHDGLALTAALLATLEHRPGQRSFGEAWFLVRA